MGGEWVGSALGCALVAVEVGGVKVIGVFPKFWVGGPGAEVVGGEAAAVRVAEGVVDGLAADPAWPVLLAEVGHEAAVAAGGSAGGCD